jgi:translation initiation factor 1 (eIF-1/SUI1)
MQNFQTNGRLSKEGKEGGKDKDRKRDREEEEENPNQREEIIIQGDHRERIKEFLIYMGISDNENIRVHGAS